MSYRRKTLIIILILIGFASLNVVGQQRGKASYYSKRMTGARTSSGERLHHDSMTCAHRSYPFGTMLRVTNPANDRYVDVRVTDRGPYIRGRIIDLSWGAAKRLGMLSQGIAMVLVQPLDHIVVPFKASGHIQFPELSYERTVSEFDFKPTWDEMKDQRREEARKKKEEMFPKRPVGRKRHR